VESLAVKRNEFPTQRLGTHSTDRTILGRARLADWLPLVLNVSARQFAAARVAGEATRVPVLAVCSEDCFCDSIVATSAAMPVYAIRVEGTTLLDDVLICDAAFTLGAGHHVADTVCAVRLPMVVVERSTKLGSAARAVKVVWMPASAKSSQVLTKDALTAFSATVS